MTDPLVPAEVDLRGLPYMPLDVNRLRDSDLAISCDPEEFRAAVLLWCASWTQVPAASVPDDDKILAQLAGFGRDVKAWRKRKVGAMRGFLLCSDGRFYHEVVAEKANLAWEERLSYRDKKDNDAERQRQFRAEHRALRKELRGYGVILSFNESMESLRSRVELERLQRTRTETVTVTGPLPATPCATAKKGREGKGREGIKEQELSPDSPAGESEPAGKGAVPYSAAFLKFWAAYPSKEGKAAAFKSWKRQKLDSQADELIADVQARQKRNRRWLDGYIPNGSTYVNQRRWGDDIGDGSKAVADSGGYVPLAGEK